MAGVVAILLAAGAGERLGGEEPKGFLRIAGVTILEMAAGSAAASPEVDSLVVVVPPPYDRRPGPEVGKPLAMVAGGGARQESVRLALEAVPDEVETVVVHDAARCLASPGLFSLVIAALTDADGAIPVVPIRDTVKRVRDGFVVGTEARGGLAAAQTPQAFRAQTLRDVHAQAAAEGLIFTDDAGMLEWAGYRVAAVPGEETNLKVTTPTDLILVEALAARKAPP